MRPLIIAHRGASHLAPENTLTSFRLAKTLGADGFECDVQLTKDRHLVWPMTTSPTSRPASTATSRT